MIMPKRNKTVQPLSEGTGERLLSAYKTLKGQKIWIITEADRSSSCVLLPSEY
jgi:hypothetical protein